LESPEAPGSTGRFPFRESKIGPHFSGSHTNFIPFNIAILTSRAEVFGAVETTQNQSIMIGDRLEKSADSELQRTTAQLERSQSALREAHQAVSHDLQSPLTTITGFADLLSRRYADRLDPDAKEFIHYIERGAARLRDMLDDLTRYLEVGDAQAPAAPVDTPRVVQAAVDALPDEIATAKATITVEPLPHVRGDSTQLCQLFRELIANALAYGDGEAPRVRIDASRSPGETCFSVTDNGAGIAQNEAPKVFDLFQRLHTADSGSGTGSGLAICKRIVERHGGRIWVEESPAGGTCIRFTLPDRAP
jgi:light-regulated signal transduction histidine kinase (bacteriophytochrome)